MVRQQSSLRRVLVGALVSSLVVLTSPSSIARAADGDLDPTYGSGGKVALAYSPANDYVNDVATYSDGRSLMVGILSYSGTNRFGLARYNADGTLDTTLNSSGLLSTTFGANAAVATSVAVQSDGKFVVAGYYSTGTGQVMAVARYSATGVLDNTFDGDGTALIEARTTPASPVDDWATDVMVQSDGKIILVGRSSDGSVYQPAVVRLNQNGSIDFRTVLNTTDANVRAGALQADGKILLGGFLTSPGDNFAVWRFNTDGALDNSFGTNGAAVFDVNPTGSTNDSIYSLAVESDGKIVAGGNINYNQAGSDFALMRLTTAGALDTTFSGDGRHVQSLVAGTDNLEKIALQRDGKIIAVGSSGSTTSADVAVVRFTSAGTLDTTFSGDGIYTVPVGTNVDTATAVGIQSNGKIYVGGDFTAAGGSKDWFSLRVDATSSLSTLASMSTSGITTTQSFAPTTTSYSATVSNETTSFTVTPSVTDSNASVKVNGVTVSSGSASAAIPLTVGTNTVTVVVTAQDGVTTTSYSIVVTRNAAASAAPSTETTLPPSTTTTSTTTTIAPRPQPTVKVKKTITAKSVLYSRYITLSSTSKVVITVKTSSKKYCSISGTRVKGVKKGNCTVVVAVTPKATKTVKKPKTTKTTVTVRVI